MKNIVKKASLIVTFSLLIMGCGEDRAGTVEESDSRDSAVAGVSMMGDSTPKDSDGDGLSDEYEIDHGLNPLQIDTDEDGLDDRYEVLHSEVDPKNPDSDGDGLSDGDEVNRYLTEPNNTDTDNDGLSDYEEIFTFGTDPLLSDSDGDCLLDSFEIANYETNASNSDTDGDNVADGIEIYSYDPEELNVSCLSSPETLEQGFNPNPAMDGVPDREHDVINALDPSNDSDGDGQSNIKENNCTEGDPLDATEICPFIHETEEGNILTEHGYSYVPGGFDVDGDGVIEGGFWMSRYQARSSGVEISTEEVIASVGNVNKYISQNFKVLNRDIEVTSYNESPLDESSVTAGSYLIFDEESVTGLKRISNFTPYMALVCLSHYNLRNKNGELLDINITMPTLKQYIQVKMLLDADLANNGDGRHIRNGLLGTDKNVPIFDYNLIIDEFGEERKEFVRNLIQLRDIHDNQTFDIEDIPQWWDVNESKFKSFNDGAHSTQDLGHGIGPDKDPYAVIVRGGSVLDVTEGVAGALTDDEGQTNGISFRAATNYLY